MMELMLTAILLTLSFSSAVALRCSKCNFEVDANGVTTGDKNCLDMTYKGRELHVECPPDQTCSVNVTVDGKYESWYRGCVDASCTGSELAVNGTYSTYYKCCNTDKCNSNNPPIISGIRLSCLTCDSSADAGCVTPTNSTKDFSGQCSSANDIYCMTNVDKTGNSGTVKRSCAPTCTESTSIGSSDGVPYQRLTRCCRSMNCNSEFLLDVGSAGAGVGVGVSISQGVLALGVLLFYIGH